MTGHASSQPHRDLSALLASQLGATAAAYGGVEETVSAPSLVGVLSIADCKFGVEEKVIVRTTKEMDQFFKGGTIHDSSAKNFKVKPAGSVLTSVLASGSSQEGV